ncbi:MAG: hypothetical protein AAF629_32695 [Chloroflexota bacterium]
MANEFEKALAAIKSGELEFGRQLLLGLLKTDGNNVTYLLWLTQTGLTIDQTENILERILLIDPDHKVAQSGLEKVQAQKAGTYTPPPKPAPPPPPKKTLLQSPSKVATATLSQSSPPTATVTGAYVLELLALKDEQLDDTLFRVYGQIKNISDKNLQSVVAEAEFFAENKRPIRTADTLIERKLILPGQTSPFEIVTTDEPHIAHYIVTFKRLFGSTIPTLDNR